MNSPLSDGDPDARKQIHTCPSLPAARFDLNRDTWTLSRYADVQAALREPALHPDGARSDAGARGQIAALNASFDFAKWQETTKSIGEILDAALSDGVPVDLIRQAIRPWCGSLSAAVLHLDRKAASRLGALAPYISGSTEDDARIRRKFADWMADRILNRSHAAAAKSTFLGIAQTLLNFIANAWIFMLEHPEVHGLLRAHPEAASRVMEELLRCSGPVHTLVRRAEDPLSIAGAHIGAGQRVVLRISEANRDPEQFTDDGRLDRMQGSAGHLALGAGPHACPAAILVRTASLRAVQDFAKFADRIEITKPVCWRNGATLRMPLSFVVRKRVDV